MPSFERLAKRGGLPFLGAAAGAIVATVMSTVSSADVLEVERTIPDRLLSQLQPGALYEVNRTVASAPLCELTAGADARAEEARRRLYVNVLGEAAPILASANALVGLGESGEARTSLEMRFLVEAFRAGWLPSPQERCEIKAIRAAARGSVVCVVDAVLRDPDTRKPFAVRFKEFAFTPQGAKSYPRCPLAEPGFGLATLKSWLIAVREVVDEIGDETGATALVPTGSGA